jgi:hypothetical protein
MTKRVVFKVASTALLALAVACCAGYGQDREPGTATPITGRASQSRALGGQVFTSSMYGIKFVYSPSYNFEPGRYTGFTEPDFANQKGVVVFGTVEIPSALYPETNLEGGKLAVSVSLAINNRAACDQFASGEPESTVTINGISYSVANRVTAGLGHRQNYEIFHTFQNAFCYELIFEIDLSNRGNLEDPSSVQEFTDGPKIQNALLSGVSFFRPVAKPPSRTAGHPKILSFSPSSNVAGHGVDSRITFSWTSQNVDYVRLQYRCAKGAVIVDDRGTDAQCDSDSPAPNYSPDGSTAVIFGNSILDSPDQLSIPVTITLVPYADGIAYRNLSKSVTIAISPYNAFPGRVPTSDVDMSLTLQSAANGGEFRFAHGSTVTIRWMVHLAAPLAPCVNLYLVQDYAQGGEAYLYKLSRPCLIPGTSGSSSWTIPERFSGAGFRILGAIPGSVAHALSRPFSIY